jgi:hypothetical protein
MRQKNKDNGEMSERQAERILETFQNGSRNGEQWAHDVVLQRGKESYQKNIDTLNEAFRLKSINIVIKSLAREVENTKSPVDVPQARKKGTPRAFKS